MVLSPQVKKLKGVYLAPNLSLEMSFLGLVFLSCLEQDAPV